MNTAYMAGAARVCITPAPELFPVTHFMNHMTPGKPSVFSGKIREDIFVRALVVQQGEERVALVVADLPGTPEVPENMRIIAECAGVDEEHVIYTCTHNHSGLYADNPVFERIFGEDFTKKMVAYRSFLREKIRQAVTEAVQNMRPAKPGVHRGQCFLNVNRNERELGPRAGTYGYNVGGPTDRDLFLVRFDDLEGKTIALLYNFSVHACMMIHNNPEGLGTEISGDFVGGACRILEKQWNEEPVVMFTSGAAGDMNPIQMSRVNIVRPDGSIETRDLGPAGPTILEFMSNRLARDVQKANEEIRTEAETGCVWSRKKSFSLPADRIFPYDPPERRPKGDVVFTMGLTMLGSAAVISTNGEIFNQIGRRMKDASPFPDTFMITHCGPHSGYMKDDSGNGLYELTAQKVFRELTDEFLAEHE